MNHPSHCSIVLVVFALFSFNSCNTHSTEPLEKTSNRATQQSNTLSSAFLTFRVAPDTGGRIASLRFRGKEVLSRIKDADNFLWGSTIWPAPQSAWGWPPPVALDQGAYTVITQSESSIILVSPINAYRSLQLRKQFILTKPNTIDIIYTFMNRGDTSIQTGIWEITRVPYAGRAAWKSGMIKEHSYPGVTQVDSTGYFAFQGQDKPGKLFINSNGGWVSYTHQGIIFKKEFEVIAAEDVAPEQAPIEIYFDPPRQFAEIEQHGRYVDIAPGEQTTFRVRWILSEE